MARIIVTGDDFGRSAAVNAATLAAHRAGVLTSASLMITGDAAEEAVAIARATPTLAVGLHLVLADARPALPPSELANLVGPDGRLERDPARAGLRLAARAAARDEARRELAAQAERFAATGLPLSHVDGHHHLHVHPAVFPAVLALAVRHGARGLRLPDEGLRELPRAAPARAALDGLALAILARGRRAAARRQGLAAPGEVHGVVRSGRMSAAYLCELIARITAPSAEIFLHPSLEDEEPRGPNAGDLAALLDPAVRAALEARGHQLTTYAGLAEAA